jgi:hypothetical protein
MSLKPQGKDMRAARDFRLLGALLCCLFASTVEAATVTVAWDPNPEPDVNGYNVYVSSNPANMGGGTNIGNRTNWTFVGLQSNVVYYFGVQARSSSGAVSPIAILGHAMPPPIPAGSEQSRSDFNADGKFDVIWQHDPSGQLLAWHMNGAAVVGARYLTPDRAGAGWKLRGSGDFNVDGKPDLVWHNDTTGDIAFWLMDGVWCYASGFFNPSRVAAPWTIASVRDLNRDGHPDLIWHNTTTGHIQAWLMNGINAISAVWLNPSQVSSAYKLKAMADFSGDGWADILWHNETNGELRIWTMAGVNATGSYAITWNGTPQAVGPPWKVVAVGDANLDGAPDIFWENGTTGQVIVWALAGAQLFGAPTIGTVDPAWKISAPR